MSENVETIIHRATNAFSDRDVESFVGCFHPEAELLLPRNLLEGGSYRGHTGIRQALADAYETWEEIHFELDDIRVLDDGAVILGRTTNVGKGDAPAVEYESAYLVRVRDGKIVYYRPYQSHHEALEAVGLSE